MKKVISFTKKDDFLFSLQFPLLGDIWGDMGGYGAGWGCIGLYRAVWGCIGLYGDSD